MRVVATGRLRNAHRVHHMPARKLLLFFFTLSASLASEVCEDTNSEKKCSKAVKKAECSSTKNHASHGVHLNTLV